MILSPALAEKAQSLAETDEALLPLFAPFERSVNVALKRMLKNDPASVAKPGVSGHILHYPLQVQ